MASNGLWKLFAETGDIRLYLLYREETAMELAPEYGERDTAEKDRKTLQKGDIPRG